MASSPRAGLVSVRIGLGAWLSGRRGPGWGGPALAGRRALAPRLYAALCGPYGQQSSCRPRLGARSAWVRVNDAAAGSARAGGARRSRAAGPSRPGCMLRCMDLWPAVLVQASFRCGSAWVLDVGTARPGLGGPGARGRRALGAPAVRCAVLPYGQQSSWRPRFGAARLACGLSDAAAGSGPGRGVPALAGRRRALAPRLYAALYGPMASSPRAGLVSVWIGLGAGCRDGAARAGPALGGPPGPSRPAVCCAVLTYDQQSSCRPRLGAARLGCGLTDDRRRLPGPGPALAGRRALAPRLYAALCGPYGWRCSWRPRRGAARLGCGFD